ncbi:MAG: hypothetical protein EHM93_05185 [Bacteroidales bacterium]|nr:MAG: hypothetical protein EHM93_05185 [Bacteroidales bacterium]
MKIFFKLIFIVIVIGCNKENKETSDIIPLEAVPKTAYITYLTPPNNFKSVIGWITAIHDRRTTQPSFIEIDYLRLYARVNGVDILLNSDEYNDNKAEGGLFLRNPWFGENNNNPILYEYRNSENLILRTSIKPDNVWHVWNNKWPRVNVPVNTERCWLEVKCKITGSALIQIGIDFWRDSTSLWAGYHVNNIEAGVSNWYYEQGVWHIIAFAKP